MPKTLYNRYNRILVALDISEPSVFETSLSIAAATGADLLLLHVLSDHDTQSPSFPITPSITTAIATDREYTTPWDQDTWKIYQRQWKAYVDESLGILRDYTERAEAAEVTADFLQTTDLPSKGICKAAKTWQADLIVMGSHQRKGLHELLLGSVSNDVMHHAPCSVMIVSLENNHLSRRIKSLVESSVESYQSV